MEDEGQDSQVGSVEDQNISQDPVGGSDSGTGINPAWNDLLSAVPAGLHSQITPHLSKWDNNFQTKINEVHSQYEPYKPFIENQINPEQIDYALSLLNAVEERPQDVLKAIQAYIGEDSGQGLEDNGQVNEETPEYLQHPEIQRMQQMVDTMAQLLVQQRQDEAQAAADSELERDLQAAKDELGDYDEEWVLNKLLGNQNMSVKDAVQAYKEFEQSIISRHRQPGPPVLPAGGSIPNPSFQPGKLEGKDRRATVAQMLAQAAQQNH